MPISFPGGVSISGAFTAGNIPVFTANGLIQDSGAAPTNTTQPIDWSGNGAASTPGVKVSGTWFTGGSTTTTKPQLLVEPAGTTTTGWSTGGTGLGVNAPSGFAGNLFDFKINNASQALFESSTIAFKVANASGFGAQLRYLGISTRSTGYIGWANTDSADGTIGTTLVREATGIIGSASSLRVMNATAIPAGGTASAGYKFSSTADFGVFFGSGAPSLAAAKGSLYLRSDGSGTTDRAYINTNGSTTWTALTTVA